MSGPPSLGSRSGSGARGSGQGLVVQASALGTKRQLNRGANGTIWQLQAYQLPDVQGPIVYKEYMRGRVTVSKPALLNVVKARGAISPKTLPSFDAMTVWPLRVVVDDADLPCGVLMRLIPRSFFVDIFMKFTGAMESTPREVQHLIYDVQRARSNNVDVPDANDAKLRIKLCERLSSLLAVLHKADYVYGDLSARNVLYQLTPTPSVMLVDCDAARKRGNAAVIKQQDSPDWDPPETSVALLRGQPSIQSMATDQYKLGLFVLRCLTPGRGSSTNRDPAGAKRALGAQYGPMLERALTGSPAERPTAAQWAQGLRAILGERSPSITVAPAQTTASKNNTSKPTKKTAPVAPPTTTHPGWTRADDGSWVQR